MWQLPLVFIVAECVPSSLGSVADFLTPGGAQCLEWQVEGRWCWRTACLSSCLVLTVARSVLGHDASESGGCRHEPSSSSDPLCVGSRIPSQQSHERSVSCFCGSSWAAGLNILLQYSVEYSAISYEDTTVPVLQVKKLRFTEVKKLTVATQFTSESQLVGGLPLAFLQ